MRTACLAYDEDAAQEILRRAMSVLHPHEVIRAVVLPAAPQVGRDWEDGLVTVAQEHFTSVISRRFALRLMDLYQIPCGLPAIVCACAPGELHKLGLLAVALELRAFGYPVVNLGQDTPVDALVSTIARLRAPVTVVSVALPEHPDPWVAARKEIEDLHRSPGSTIVWGGPGALPAASRGLPGPGAATINEAVASAVSLYAQAGLLA